MSFSEDELVYIVRDLFIAATDTTATTMNWAVMYIAGKKDVQDKVRL